MLPTKRFCRGVNSIKHRRRTFQKVFVCAAFVLLAVTARASSIDVPLSGFADIDFAQSPYKHINNGGIATQELLPYNVDAITGATVTVEGPAVVASIPLSMREIENRNDGLFRGVYTDANGARVYEGLDLYYLLNGMTQGDSGILLTDSAHKAVLKDCNRVIIAEIPLGEIAAAHQRGRPYLLAYGVGMIDGTLAAPFVFDAANPNEHSEGYIAELDNADGCLRFVYDAGDGEAHSFTNVAYVYICEETEPGAKHTGGAEEAYASSRYTDYILTFRGEALGAEMNFTVEQLENLVRYDTEGEVIEGGIGYSDLYSLANNAYWYVNEYEGLDLYKLLLYLGMDDAETMGLAASRLTLASFIADDGVPSQESFSVDALSYPDAFGFYNKNAVDAGDGSYAPTNADLVRTGYPVLLAYGVNNYPYTITKSDAGYLSGLSNSGGPMRVVFGKTQYNHANGSHQVQYVRDVIVGKDVLYNTHRYTDVPAHRALADNTLAITVNGEDGGMILERTMTVGDIEDILYGEGVSGSTIKAARVKDHFQRKTDGGYDSEMYEGIHLSYFLLEVLGLPGTNGTATFTSASGETVTVNLGALLRTGYNTELLRDKLSPVIAFARNGSPMVADESAPGYVDAIPLRPTLATEPAQYAVQNSGGPLAVLIPSASPEQCDAVSIENLTAIVIDLVPDAYAHLRPPYVGYAEGTVRLYGDGLEREAVFTAREIESRQTKAKTLSYGMLDLNGQPMERRFRGVPVYDLLVETGIKSNAGDVMIYTSGGEQYQYPLSTLKKKNYANTVSPEKEPLMAIVSYGTGASGGDAMDGLPLVPAVSSAGYDAAYGNDGGPLALVLPGDTAEASAVIKNVVAIQVTANEIDSWGHRMSDIYNEFLDFEFTLSIKNDDSEWSRTFTVGQLEAMEDLIVRDTYTVLDIGECEGIDIWKWIKRFAGNVPGIDDPVSITVYATDGYKNDLLSVFYKEGFELGIADEDGNRKPLIIAYAVNGLPIVDAESHEGYTGIAGNANGPLRVIAETNQGASVKFASKLVVTVPGSGALDGYIEGKQ